MNKKAVMQGSAISEVNPLSLCAFDYETIEKPTKALMHQTARVIYFNRGRGKIRIDEVEYDIVPHTLCAITPWKVTDIVDVRDTLHLNLLVYDFQYVNTFLKLAPGMEEESGQLLNFLLSHPVAYLDKEQSLIVDKIMADLEEELGVDSAAVRQSIRPFKQL